MFEGFTLIAAFQKAGLTRWPLLICSVIGLAIILERSYFFFRIRFKYSQFSRELFILLKNNQLMQAIHKCQKEVNPVPQIAGIFLQNLQNKRRDSILSRHGSYAIEKVENRLRGLATITHIAPLLGLLGTIAGLVVAFHEIQLTPGQIQAQNLAGGIWEALLSTVFGLIVAIPCMVAYHTFESYADRVARRMQFMISELEEFYGEKQGKNISNPSLESKLDEGNVAE